MTVIDQPFVAHGNVETAGRLAAQYLATWLILRLATQDDALAAVEKGMSWR